MNDRPLCLHCGVDFEPYPDDWPEASREPFCSAECKYAHGLTECECDNTHEQNDTVCMYCWDHGRRHWNDPDVPVASPATT